ncbi:uncharacterized protein QC763_210090 [Podospora pseudopauciseta]|uniref:BZIP domain-containing protein n=1 Tax=Podospora pseudopauciseta TaxID=2093780 RepID=A0ABR0HQ78_9PEZI|nr:hypothetical protein QC763_210090 [Podospora pseudopauciseta]
MQDRTLLPKEKTTPGAMFAMVDPAVNSGFQSFGGNNQHSSFVFSSPHKPAKSSPLSYTPMRIPSPTLPSDDAPDMMLSSPLGPPSDSSHLRMSQSSPIRSSFDNNESSGPQPKFRFANRNPAKNSNPLVKKRNDVQDSRRRLFLNNVRQRQEDKKFQRRGGQDEIARLEFNRLQNERLAYLDRERAKNPYALWEQELEDEHRSLQSQQWQMQQQNPDEMMLDALEEAEMAEIAQAEALLHQDNNSSRHINQDDSFDDDEDWDELFMEAIQTSQQHHIQGQQSDGQDVEMS